MAFRNGVLTKIGELLGLETKVGRQGFKKSWQPKLGARVRAAKVGCKGSLIPGRQSTCTSVLGSPTSAANASHCLLITHFRWIDCNLLYATFNTSDLALSRNRTRNVLVADTNYHCLALAFE